MSNFNTRHQFQEQYQETRQEVIQNEITEILDRTQCSCLNESSEGSFSRGNITVKSMVDPQLVMQLFFRQAVSITHIEFETTTTNTCPKTIKLFQNKLNMGFDDASSLPPIEIIKLYPSKSVHKIKLTKPASWKYSNIIHLFVENNHGGESTEIKNIKLYGSIVDNTDVSQIRRMGCGC